MNKAVETELKRCPFCGVEGVIARSGAMYSVQCECCGAETCFQTSRAAVVKA